MTHAITINDGKYAPYCTAEAIKDHIGELRSAGNLSATVKIEFSSDWTETTKKAYLNAFKDYEFGNISVKFPWGGGAKK